MVLVSNAEIEKLFGWTKGKAGVYATRGILPEPVQTLACGRLWRLDDVLSVAKERGWNVSDPALREIHASAMTQTEATRDMLAEEVVSLRAQVEEYRRLAEEEVRERQNAEQALANLEREYEWMRARLIDAKNEYAELAARVERLRNEETRLLRNLASLR